MLGLLLVAVSVGLSNFAGAIAIGLSGIDNRTRLRVGLAFGAFEAAMPAAGLVVGAGLAGSLDGAGRYAGGGALALTGIYTLVRARGGDGRRASPATAGRRLLVTAFALSADNLVVGFALGVYRVPVPIAAGVIGVVSVGLSLLGLELGSRLGGRVEAWSEEIGGGVLVLVGAAIALGVMR